MANRPSLTALLCLQVLVAAAATAAPACDAEACQQDSLSLFQRRDTTKLKALDEKDTANTSISFIYTVGCDHYELVQAVVLDHTWKEIENKGKLTRIVVGCKEEAAQELLRSSPLKDDKRFKVFYAQGDLMTVPGKGRYPWRAKPYGIMKWLESEKPEESVVAILDPDFVFFRPISSHPDLPKVRPGQMLAQRYDLGMDFMKGFKEAGEEAPALTFHEAVDSYGTGAPYVLHMEDLRAIMPDWCRYTDSWPKEKGLMREQNSFAMAALKHNLPSLGQNIFMVSNTAAWNEAWSEKDSRLGSWEPYVLHYCQTYDYGNWSFHKSMIADNRYDNRVPGPLHCGAPLLQEPPSPPAEEADRSKFMNAWMLWKLLPAMNKAFAAYREIYCPSEKATKVGGQMLMRTMQPKLCNARTTTIYRVTPVQESSWLSTGVRGDDPCAEAAQAPVL